MNWRVDKYREVSEKRQALYGDVGLGNMAGDLRKANPQINDESAWTDIINSYGDWILDVAPPENVENVFKRYGVKNAEHEAQRFLTYILYRLV